MHEVLCLSKLHLCFKTFTAEKGTDSSLLKKSSTLWRLKLVALPSGVATGGWIDISYQWRFKKVDSQSHQAFYFIPRFEVYLNVLLYLVEKRVP